VAGLGFGLDIGVHNVKLSDMEFMNKFWIQLDCKISISVHHWYTTHRLKFASNSFEDIRL